MGNQITQDGNLEVTIKSSQPSSTNPQEFTIKVPVSALQNFQGLGSLQGNSYSSNMKGNSINNFATRNNFSFGGAGGGVGNSSVGSFRGNNSAGYRDSFSGRFDRKDFSYRHEAKHDYDDYLHDFEEDDFETYEEEQARIIEKKNEISSYMKQRIFTPKFWDVPNNNRYDPIFGDARQQSFDFSKGSSRLSQSSMSQEEECSLTLMEDINVDISTERFEDGKSFEQRKAEEEKRESERKIKEELDRFNGQLDGIFGEQHRKALQIDTEFDEATGQYEVRVTPKNNPDFNFNVKIPKLDFDCDDSFELENPNLKGLMKKKVSGSFLNDHKKSPQSELDSVFNRGEFSHSFLSNKLEQEDEEDNFDKENRAKKDNNFSQSYIQADLSRGCLKDGNEGGQKKSNGAEDHGSNDYYLKVDNDREDGRDHLFLPNPSSERLRLDEGYNDEVDYSHNYEAKKQTEKSDLIRELESSVVFETQIDESCHLEDKNLEEVKDVYVDKLDDYIHIRGDDIVGPSSHVSNKDLTTVQEAVMEESNPTTGEKTFHSHAARDLLVQNQGLISTARERCTSLRNDFVMSTLTKKILLGVDHATNGSIGTNMTNTNSVEKREMLDGRLQDVTKRLEMINQNSFANQQINDIASGRRLGSSKRFGELEIDVEDINHEEKFESNEVDNTSQVSLDTPVMRALSNIQNKIDELNTMMVVDKDQDPVLGEKITIRGSNRQGDGSEKKKLGEFSSYQYEKISKNRFSNYENDKENMVHSHAFEAKTARHNTGYGHNESLRLTEVEKDRTKSFLDSLINKKPIFGDENLDRVPRYAGKKPIRETNRERSSYRERLEELEDKENRSQINQTLPDSQQEDSKPVLREISQAEASQKSLKIARNASEKRYKTAQNMPKNTSSRNLGSSLSLAISQSHLNTSANIQGANLQNKLTSTTNHFLKDMNKSTVIQSNNYTKKSTDILQSSINFTIETQNDLESRNLDASSRFNTKNSLYDNKDDFLFGAMGKSREVDKENMNICKSNLTQNTLKRSLAESSTVSQQLMEQIMKSRSLMRSRFNSRNCNKNSNL